MVCRQRLLGTLAKSLMWRSCNVVALQVCRGQPKRKKGTVSGAEYDLLLATYEPECQANTTVSSPRMEAEAVKIFSRSVEKHNLRYTNYIGDGDSKAHATVRDCKVYGETEIHKEECIGHVQKRVGKNLHDLISRLGSQKLAGGKSIGGRGRLTDALIDSLQNYYGRAVRQHSESISDMARAIWASFCHNFMFSTYEAPKHGFCPQALSLGVVGKRLQQQATLTLTRSSCPWHFVT